MYTIIMGAILRIVTGIIILFFKYDNEMLTQAALEQSNSSTVDPCHQADDVGKLIFKKVQKSAFSSLCDAHVLYHAHSFQDQTTRL